MNRTDYQYCPYCGSRLYLRERYGRVRPVCEPCGFVQFRDPKVAVIAFVTCENRVLLIQRGVDPAKGLWALPGGYMDAGEMPDSALQREVREEVGISICVHHLLAIFPMAGPGVVNRGIVLAFAATPVDGSVAVLTSDDDVMDARWFAPDELPLELAFESTQSLLVQWRQAQRE
jgi:ADP-ribose pyrophosphatase YjhB (NUDIX family)